MTQKPYIVLLGKVGSGKSALVEKLTGETGRASNDKASATRCSEVFWSHNGEFIISDTPGSNSSSDQFEHNMWIATALNYMPVSKIMIVVKADSGRIDGIIDGIREFSDRFIDLPFDPLGIIVTHMDMDLVTWTEEEVRESIEENLDMHDIVFSDMDTPADTLIEKILEVSTEAFDLTVNHENFLSIFKNLHKNTPRQLLQFCSRELTDFKKRQEDFNIKRDEFEDHQVDLVFEFQAFMKQQIVEVQKKMYSENNFTFDGEQGKNEVAYIQNLTNQLISVLRKIRIEAQGYQHDLQCVLRKCPHCNQVWTKVQGCDYETICGERPTSTIDLRSPEYAVMATFTFQWNTVEKTLNISRGGNKTVSNQTSGESGTAGCGKSITWHEMAEVVVPTEFSSTVRVVRMSDVAMLPDGEAAAKFNDSLDDTLDSFKNQMVLTPRSNPAESLKCAVCKKAAIQMVILRCGHSCTCEACAALLLKMNSKCPICRGVISEIRRKLYPTLV